MWACSTARNVTVTGETKRDVLLMQERNNAVFSAKQNLLSQYSEVESALGK
jgi:hypothetical protein